MKIETRIHSKNSVQACQNCHGEFTIEPADFNFYEKISSNSGGKVPPPTWCPECRLIRRFSFQNTWNLSWRNCDECNKKTLSIYPPEQKITVYCQKCWWADSWDGTEYAMDYDPKRNFLEQVRELADTIPYVGLETGYLTLKNSDYSNSMGWCRDCYLVFWADFCDSVYYSSILNALKHSSDCLRAKDSELCYESIGINKCYQTFFSEECDACVNVYFSRNCYGCTNCIGCVNLRGASYYIFNVKYSKEEYEEKLKEFKINSWQGLEELKQKAQNFWLTKPYREYTGNSLNLNVTGEYVYESKNSKNLYICSGAEDCKWAQFITVGPAKDCVDYSGWGNNATQIYESISIGENSNSVYFSFGCHPDSLNLQYCYWNIAGKNNFGCVNLKRKHYCILNKEYPKEEYEKLKAQIIEDMKKNPYIDKKGRKFPYGEFFPPEFSKHSYNRSIAMQFFPKTKEQAISEGYFWLDIEKPRHKISLQSSSLPDTIKETDKVILNETIGCSICGYAYKITKGELGLLNKMNLPLPHECPKCRDSRRLSRLSPIKLYKRFCAKCNSAINTAFAPDRTEVIYCEKCYQQEFI